jgi:catechol 2,3-dioxygenase-like lactoylglutathione lyase family enzyme
MIDHTGIAVADFAASKRFYDAVFAALGGAELVVVPVEYTGGAKVTGYGRDRPVFWLHEGGEPGPGRHVAFTADTRDQVAAFHRVALAAGGRDNGGPGLRPQYHKDYFGAFALDPDGNNIEAVCHRPA